VGQQEAVLETLLDPNRHISRDSEEKSLPLWDSTSDLMEIIPEQKERNCKKSNTVIQFKVAKPLGNEGYCRHRWPLWDATAIARKNCFHLLNSEMIFGNHYK
jgi:hypothetical protein